MAKKTNPKEMAYQLMVMLGEIKNEVERGGEPLSLKEIENLYGLATEINGHFDDPQAAYDRRHEYLTSNFVREMAEEIPDNKVIYDFVSMSYAYLDGLGDNDIKEWTNEELMRGFIAFVNDNYKKFVDESSPVKHLEIHPSKDAETIELTFGEISFPIAYEARKKELESQGLSGKELERSLNEPVLMEAYYSPERGFFLVESEALVCTDVYDPYTGLEMID